MAKNKYRSRPEGAERWVIERIDTGEDVCVAPFKATARMVVRALNAEMSPHERKVLAHLRKQVMALRHAIDNVRFLALHVGDNEQTKAMAQAIRSECERALDPKYRKARRAVADD